MSLSFNIPEIDLKNLDTEEFLRKFNKNEFVLVKNTFSKKFLNELYKSSKKYFDNYDYKYKNDNIINHELDQYFGSFHFIRKICKKNPRIMNIFYENILNSNLSEIFKKKFSGNFFVSESENCIRRASARHYLRATGLHKDGQLSLASKKAFKSNEELTIWTPLVDCIDENTPRLLLLDKDTLTLESILDNDDYFFDNGVKYLSIQLKPFAYQNESEFSYREKNKPYI